VKTASKMTYTVSGGALNSAQSNSTLPITPPPITISKNRILGTSSRWAELIPFFRLINR